MFNSLTESEKTNEVYKVKEKEWEFYRKEKVFTKSFSNQVESKLKGNDEESL